MRVQTFADWELLAVDDASTDDSHERLLRCRDARIRVFHSAVNQGPAAARNLALRAARGATITYLDCDDEYYPDYLDQVHAWGRRTDVCFFAYDRIGQVPEGSGNWVMQAWDPAPVCEQLMVRNVSCPLGVAHRRDLLERSGLFDEWLYFEEDWDLWKRFARVGASFAVSAHKSGRYHVHGESLSRTHRAPDACGKQRAQVRRTMPTLRISGNWRNPSQMEWGGALAVDSSGQIERTLDIPEAAYVRIEQALAQNHTEGAVLLGAGARLNWFFDR